MSSQDIQALTALLQRYGIAEFEYQDGTRHVVLSAAQLPAALPLLAEPIAPTERPSIRTPYAGVFHAADPQAVTPRAVSQGEIIGYVQVGQVLRPVVAPSAGQISDALIAEGTLTGYGTPVFDYL